jgi:transglutaminase-like putative cysteine protease
MQSQSKLIMKYAKILFCAAFISVTFAAIAQARPLVLDRSAFPHNWTLQKTISVPESNLAAFSRKLGGDIVSLKNYIFDAAGIRLQVNVLKAATKADAARLYETLLGIRQNTLFVRRADTAVVEYISPNLNVIKKAGAVMGLSDDKAVTWTVRARLAPLEKADYMQWNILYNRLKDHQEEASAQTGSAVEQIRPDFVFGRQITLISPDVLGQRAEFDFTPPALRKEARKDITTYVFEDMEKTLGIPLVLWEATIPVKAFTSYLPKGPVDTSRLTAATQFWPVTDPRITRIRDSLIAPEMADRQKAEALLGWVYTNIRYDGRVTGSRYGIEKVLDQGYGHCWDKSDVFITLCRSAGLSARQVFGWMQGVSGHIWAEVYLEGTGWMPVDATTSWLGVTESYIPFSISEDGRISFVYWSEPEIQSE